MSKTSATKGWCGTDDGFDLPRGRACWLAPAGFVSDKPLREAGDLIAVQSLRGCAALTCGVLIYGLMLM
jgi:hypothetical protein